MWLAAGLIPQTASHLLGQVEEHSIRQSGVRGHRKNEMPIDDFEGIGQEAQMIQPNKRG